MENIREIVLDILLTLEREQEMSHRLIKNVLDKYDYLEVQEKAFIKRLAEGTLERRIELDYYLDAYSSVPVKKMKPLIRCLMRMSVYQLLYMDNIPDSAVCNEACKLAGKRKFQNLKGFVNGVLRKVAREKQNLKLPDKKDNILKYLCVKYSMPELITEQWLTVYGPELTEDILDGLLQVHPVSVRISEQVPEPEEKQIVEALKTQNVKVEKNSYLERMYLAEGLEGLERLEDFRQGKMTVQDVSSALAVKMAGIKPGDVVIDPCAAPGGKSILAAELTGETGKVFSGDVSENKTSRIEENARRMGAENIEIRQWDARQTADELIEKGDVLILDVPCSGWGVMGKKRDIKYHVTSEGLKELEELQKQIVEGAWRYVKPGGMFLYSTCTIRPQENEMMVKWILDHFPFEPVNLWEKLPEAVRLALAPIRKEKGEIQDCMVQILPGVMEADGFFFAGLRRKQQ